MGSTIQGTLMYWKGILMLTRSQMQVRSKPLVDIYLVLAVLQSLGGLASKLS